MNCDLQITQGITDCYWCRESSLAVLVRCDKEEIGRSRESDGRFKNRGKLTRIQWHFLQPHNRIFAVTPDVRSAKNKSVSPAPQKRRSNQNRKVETGRCPVLSAPPDTHLPCQTNLHSADFPPMAGGWSEGADFSRFPVVVFLGAAFRSGCGSVTRLFGGVQF